MGMKGGAKYVWVILGLVILAIIFLSTAFYTVPTGHRGVVLRFGRYSRTAAEGLHFKIPFGFETVRKIHTEQEDSESFGFRTVRAGIRTDAYYAMAKWLEHFAYRTSLGWWIFAAGGLLALLITLITVSFQAVKAALTNPVETLRYE